MTDSITEGIQFSLQDDIKFKSSLYIYNTYNEYINNYITTLYMCLAVTYFGMNTLINLRKEADHFWDIQFIGNDRSI